MNSDQFIQAVGNKANELAMAAIAEILPTVVELSAGVAALKAENTALKAENARLWALLNKNKGAE